MMPVPDSIPGSVVTDFAPLLRLDADERHFPSDPEDFRANTRFRQSNFRDSRDRGWNKALARWEESDVEGEDYTGVDWDTIRSVISRETEAPRPGGVTADGPVTRPRDPRNLWDPGSPKGFFLELKEGYGHDQSGQRPDVAPAKVFYDWHNFRDESGRPWAALAYWFFFHYNWHVVSKHEGDWEHITLYFAEERFDSFPAFVFYSAHNAGYLISGRARVWVPDDATADTIPTTPGVAGHPIVFVSRFGHPSYPIVHDPERYTWAIRTWDRDIPCVDTPDSWRDYDGAWGEVGEIVHSTGPLGPFFKRKADAVRLEDLT
jgi:hypothetical protein